MCILLSIFKTTKAWKATTGKHAKLAKTPGLKKEQLYRKFWKLANQVHPMKMASSRYTGIRQSLQEDCSSPSKLVDIRPYCY